MIFYHLRAPNVNQGEKRKVIEGGWMARRLYFPSAEGRGGLTAQLSVANRKTVRSLPRRRKG